MEFKLEEDIDSIDFSEIKQLEAEVKEVEISEEAIKFMQSIHDELSTALKIPEELLGN